MSRSAPSDVSPGPRSRRTAVRALLVAAVVVDLVAAVGLAAERSGRPLAPVRLAAAGLGTTARVVGSLASSSPPSPRSTPSPAAPSPVTTPPAAAPVTATATPAPPPAPPDALKAYRGLGAWVDWYDYGQPGNMDPAAIVDRLAGQGVRTLFLQTGLWDRSPDILNPGAMNAFVEHAHARGLAVVGWYVPGFADLDRDLRASLAVFAYATPGGQHFDGFAADIEDHTAIDQVLRRTVTVRVAPHRGCSRSCTASVVVDAPAVQVRDTFDAGIVEYSRRLRQAVPAGATLGAIVVDAKNNQRSPASWEGFPWPEIAARYDVVLPMAYWSVAKPAGCPGQDAGAYIREVVATTEALMRTPKPMHPIGGVADCLRAQDVATFVDATKATGAIGGSLYDFMTIEANPEQAAFWQALGNLNG